MLDWSGLTSDMLHIINHQLTKICNGTNKWTQASSTKFKVNVRETAGIPFCLVLIKTRRRARKHRQVVRHRLCFQLAGTT